jgi:hypothetical protein
VVISVAFEDTSIILLKDVHTTVLCHLRKTHRDSSLPSRIETLVPFSLTLSLKLSLEQITLIDTILCKNTRLQAENTFLQLVEKQKESQLLL